MTITPDGQDQVFILGKDFQDGHLPQITVPKNHWQGLKIQSDKSNAWTLLGTTVFPGFEFEDFELRD